jgi:molecular chaperone DnaK (HSP70)
MKTQSTADQSRHNLFGRLSKLSLTVMALVTLGTLSSVSGQLVGLDLGSSFMKGTLVQPGQPFSIIENTASARKTETMMTIGVENRMYGKDSFLESGKYPQTTFSDLMRIFGQRFDADEAAQLKKDRFITNEFVADPRGNYAYKINRKAVGAETEDQVEVLYAEEVVGTMLK